MKRQAWGDLLINKSDRFINTYFKFYIKKYRLDLGWNAHILLHSNRDEIGIQINIFNNPVLMCAHNAEVIKIFTINNNNNFAKIFKELYYETFLPLRLDII